MARSRAIGTRLAFVERGLYEYRGYNRGGKQWPRSRAASMDRFVTKTIDRKRNPTYWLVLSSSLLGLLLLFVPPEVMIQIGVRVSPLGTLRDKTISLFQALRIALPVLGSLGVVWLSIPAHVRRNVRRFTFNLVVSPWLVPVIMALALTLRLGWMLYYPTTLYAESNWYFDKASEIARGYGYVYDLESGKPTAAYPVGYPAFLAVLFRLTGPSTLIAKLANVVLSVSCVYFTYLLALRTFDRATAVFSALFMALLPGVIVYNSLVCSDILFVTLTTLTMVLTLCHIDQHTRGTVIALLTGLANGAMALTRSIGLALLPLWVWVRWVVVSRHSRMSSARWVVAITVGTSLVVMPWMFRNYLHFHKIIPVSINGGANFWIGNNPQAYGGFMFPRDEAHNPLLPLIGDEVAVDELGYRLGLEFIRQNPGRVLKLLPAKVFYLFNSNDQGLHWNRLSALSPNQGGAGTQIFMLTNLVYTLLVIMALLGLLILLFQRECRRMMVWVGVVTSIYWTLLHLPFFGVDRFALPLLPFMTTYAAFGVSAILAIDDPDASRMERLV
jgi:4-amino-4-deoxy-L-arabinose transferase-like glycosyltransferase